MDFLIYKYNLNLAANQFIALSRHNDVMRGLLFIVSFFVLSEWSYYQICIFNETYPQDEIQIDNINKNVQVPKIDN